MNRYLDHCNLNNNNIDEAISKASYSLGHWPGLCSGQTGREQSSQHTYSSENGQYTLSASGNLFESKLEKSGFCCW